MTLADILAIKRGGTWVFLDAEQTEFLASTLGLLGAKCTVGKDDESIPEGNTVWETPDQYSHVMLWIDTQPAYNRRRLEEFLREIGYDSK